jgi:hypothetical protein
LRDSSFLSISPFGTKINNAAAYIYKA